MRMSTPGLANRLAIARPMPFVPPVMRTAIVVSLPVGRPRAADWHSWRECVRRLCMTRIVIAPAETARWAGTMRAAAYLKVLSIEGGGGYSIWRSKGRDRPAGTVWSDRSGQLAAGACDA